MFELVQKYRQSNHSRKKLGIEKSQLKKENKTKERNTHFLPWRNQSQKMPLQSKRGGKQPVANKRAAREIKEPERQEPDTEEFETKPSNMDRGWNYHDQPCDPDLSRSPSTQHSESSPHMGDREEHLHTNHGSLKSPALRSRLQSNHGMLQPVSEHMLEEHIPQDEHEFDVTEYLNVQLSADTDHSNSSSLQIEVGTDPLL